MDNTYDILFLLKNFFLYGSDIYTPPTLSGRTIKNHFYFFRHSPF